MFFQSNGLQSAALTFYTRSLISSFLLDVVVRRVKKSQAPSKSSSSVSNENVEIITRPDGKKVRRIRKTKPSTSDQSNQLSGFLDAQPKSKPSGGAATVTGATSNVPKKQEPKKETPKAKQGMLGNFFAMESSGVKKTGAASVAGDQVAVTKEQSLTGEVYVRADGKKGKKGVAYVAFCTK